MIKTRKMFLFAVICITLFIIFYYNFGNIGNNKDIIQDKIADKILEKFNNYEAKISVNVISNKNENFYEMNQYVSNNYMKMIINYPENIKGIVIEIKDNTLRILNTLLNMEKVYENYGIITNNSLFLNTLIKDAKENDYTFEETNDEIVLKIEVKTSKNTYVRYKELHMDKNYNPKYLIIKDTSKIVRIRIVYTDIKFK
ncbi:MAG: hypothetical protein IKJ36_02315 [Clostridia bacterium]|nr:hypothetical protein [Clostridia bacterium]